MKQEDMFLQDNQQSYKFFNGLFFFFFLNNFSLFPSWKGKLCWDDGADAGILHTIYNGQKGLALKNRREGGGSKSSIFKLSQAVIKISDPGILDG